MMLATDINADGVVDFDEFCKFFQSRVAAGEVSLKKLASFWIKTTINVDVDAVGVPASASHHAPHCDL